MCIAQVAEAAPSSGSPASRPKTTAAASAMDMPDCIKPADKHSCPAATLHERIVAARISPDDELRLLRMLQDKDIPPKDVEHQLYMSRNMALEAAINSLGLSYLEARVYKRQMMRYGPTQKLWDEVDQAVAAKERRASALVYLPSAGALDPPSCMMCVLLWLVRARRAKHIGHTNTYQTY